jgi:hypothetical protein
MMEFASWWDKTLDRWYHEGLSPQLRNDEEIRAYLGLDPFFQLWIQPYIAACPKPASHGQGLIANLADYERIKPFLFPDPAFDSTKLQEWAKKQKSNDAVIWITLEGFFWFPRWLFGIDSHMLAFYDNVELMHRINQDLLEFNLRALDQCCLICTPDFMTFAEDMSYNKGPMLSKRCFDEFLAPYYCRIIPELKKRNIIPFVDSDGDIHELVDWLEQVGFEGILPLERSAGVDISHLRTKHPKFKLIGAFDKTVISRGEQAIRAEFERILPIMWQGGYIPSVDHQTPPDVSLDNYRVYVSLLREYNLKAADELAFRSRG